MSDLLNEKRALLARLEQMDRAYQEARDAAYRRSSPTGPWEELTDSVRAEVQARIERELFGGIPDGGRS